ncbi:hypothetical protein NAEX_09443 [Nannocystis exedens]|nr:hypothetical protein NAEX_09443 [Nannocystis exedens]
MAPGTGRAATEPERGCAGGGVESEGVEGCAGSRGVGSGRLRGPGLGVELGLALRGRLALRAGLLGGLIGEQPARQLLVVLLQRVVDGEELIEGGPELAGTAGRAVADHALAQGHEVVAAVHAQPALAVDAGLQDRRAAGPQEGGAAGAGGVGRAEVEGPGGHLMLVDGAGQPALAAVGALPVALQRPQLAQEVGSRIGGGDGRRLGPAGHRRGRVDERKGVADEGVQAGRDLAAEGGPAVTLEARAAAREEEDLDLRVGLAAGAEDVEEITVAPDLGPGLGGGDLVRQHRLRLRQLLGEAVDQARGLELAVGPLGRGGVARTVEVQPAAEGRGEKERDEPKPSGHGEASTVARPRRTSQRPALRAVG